VAFHIVWVGLFYVLLRPVNRTLALLATLTGLLAIGLQALGAVVQNGALTVLHAGEFSAAFTPEQLEALSYLALRSAGQTFNTYLIFFGIRCLLTGYLIYRSGFMPRFLGVLEMIAGTAYLVLLWPPLATAWHPYYLFFGVGELALVLWLLIRGVDSQRWHALNAAGNASRAQAVAAS
jgi:hypothetical protein